MLTSIQMTTVLFIAIMCVHVRLLPYVCVNFVTIFRIASNPYILKLLGLICVQFLRSVGLLAIRAGAFAVFTGPVSDTVLAKHMSAICALLRFKDYFSAHHTHKILIKFSNNLLLFQFWQAIWQFNPLISRLQLMSKLFYESLKLLPLSLREHSLSLFSTANQVGKECLHHFK